MNLKVVRGRAGASFTRKLALVALLAFAAMIASMWTGSSAYAQPGCSICPPPVVPVVGATAVTINPPANTYIAMLDPLSANGTVGSGVASQLESIRNDIRCIIRRRLNVVDKTCQLGASAIGFAPESDPYVAGYDPFEALGYAKSGMVTKARPMPGPAASNWFVSVWGQGAADREERRITFAGANFGSATRSYTGLGGIDVVKIGIVTDADAFVIGALGSDTSSRTSIGDFTESSTPGGGMDASYMSGGFSVDYSFLANFTTTRGTAGGVAFAGRETNSYVSNANMQNKFDLPSGWWVEPTVGASFTRMTTNVGGFTDGKSLRLQGGVRAGTEWSWGTARIQPTVFALAYQDVFVDNPHLTGTAFFGPTDAGYVWGKGVGKLNVQWTDKFSTYVEGELRGRADVIGYAGRIASRYTF